MLANMKEELAIFIKFRQFHVDALYHTIFVSDDCESIQINVAKIDKIIFLTKSELHERLKIQTKFRQCKVSKKINGTYQADRT